MKKIILSLSIIGAVTAIIVGGSVAYFSDTATSTSNSFHSGTLDLKLSDASGSTYSDSITGTFDVSDMAPGVTETTGTVRLKNTGSVSASHVNITSVVNTPSDDGINEPECKAYNGEWKNGFSHGWCCVISAYDEDTCANVGGAWGDTGDGEHCYAEDAIGFKDDWGNRNDIDKYLQITSIKYAGQELEFSASNENDKDVINPANTKYTEVDVNRNGYLDLDDLEKAAATGKSWLRNLTGIGSGAHRTFQMKVKLHENAGNVYQTDKDGIKITFEITQQ